MPVSPKIQILTNGRSQQFALLTAAGAPIAGAQWTIAPVGLGDISPGGLYTAPAVVAAEAQVTITATPPPGGPPIEGATVRLVPLEVVLAPTKVSLREGEMQRFDATVPGDPANDVHWNIAPRLGTIENGLYTAPADNQEDREVEVIATSAMDPRKAATATVQLQSRPPWPGVTVGLFVYLVAIFSLVVLLISLWPPPPTLAINSSASTAASVPGSNAARAAPGPAPKPAAAPTASSATSSGDKVLTWWFGEITREVDLLWLVLITGALGSFAYGARSFVDFVGNRALRASWSAWYLMYPFIGAALALIFYLAVRGGFLTTSAGNDVNVYGLTAISGLVGMFSKQATTKLSEVFGTLFKTDKSDDLKNKLGS